MADDAFALSPMVARSTQPAEADYLAIRDAFMETARGRWFLDEYAKRNRNADTELVLDAVARLERTLAQHKQQLPPAGPQTVATNVADVMAIFAALRGKAEAVAESGAAEDALAPLRESARVVQEIAWGLRESGSDSRICNLLDRQVAALNGICEKISSADIHGKLGRLFDEAAELLNEIADGDTMAATANKTSPPSNVSSPSPIMSLQDREPIATKNPTKAFRTVEPETVEFEIVEVEIPAHPTSDSPKSETPATATVSESAIPPAPSSPRMPGAQRGPTIRFEEPEQAVSPPAPAEVVPQAAIAEPDPEPESKFEAAIADTLSVSPGSLGASIVASGIVAVPSALSDPMAPFKRMSQAEKIAFFS